MCLVGEMRSQSEPQIERGSWVEWEFYALSASKAIFRASEWVSGGLMPCWQLRPSPRREHVKATYNYNLFSRIRGGGWRHSQAAPPPWTLSASRHPPSEKLKTTPHSSTFASTPPPLGHCPCAVIHIPGGGVNLIGPQAKGWNKILGMGNWGGGSSDPPPRLWAWEDSTRKDRPGCLRCLHGFRSLSTVTELTSGIYNLSLTHRSHAIIAGRRTHTNVRLAYNALTWMFTFIPGCNPV